MNLFPKSEEIKKVTEKIFKKYNSMKAFCVEKKLNYAYVNHLFNNPEKITEKYWVKIKRAAGAK